MDLLQIKMTKKSTKKYEIKQPKKCQRCGKASNCEFLKQLFQKPFDASGVLLDCKAFYTVFCELEKQCYFSPEDSEKRRKYYEEIENGKRPCLTPAMVVNGVLAAELALKALILKETGTFDCIHHLNDLFEALPDNHKNVLTALIKEKSYQNDETLKTNLETISNSFEEWRYFFEREAIGYSNFLSEFIHIVCDYAIAQAENNMTEVSG